MEVKVPFLAGGLAASVDAAALDALDVLDDDAADAVDDAEVVEEDDEEEEVAISSADFVKNAPIDF
jgi:hypothetical protein